mmetsp:Transcript_15311/g.33081  ORF Transcript_15311/g.33081 Transcript_15311/m.33081 type:complete len:829 (+) Transcript_15311:165-2651(+)
MDESKIHHSSSLSADAANSAPSSTITSSHNDGGIIAASTNTSHRGGVGGSSGALSRHASSSGALSHPKVSSHSTTATQPTAAATTTLVPRPPINVYLKIAIIRNPTDVVVCEDPEHPGRMKRLVVGNLLDEKRMTLEGKAQEENAIEGVGGGEAKVEGVKVNNTTTTTTSNNEELKPPPSESSNKKLEIPVPTITTVKQYTTDIPPTFPIPQSYVRYIPPTYEENDVTVEYNVDSEDEGWWRENEDFGPGSKGKIVWVDGSGGEVGASCTVERKASDDIRKKRAKWGDDEEVDNDNDESSFPNLTMHQVILQNPYLLQSSHSTKYLIQKYQPRLPLVVLEQMLDVLEKATGFEMIVTLQQAEEVLVRKVPRLEEIFGGISEKRLDGNTAIEVRSKTGITPLERRIPTLATPVTLKQVISQVYTYWMQKRSKLKKPLLRRYWPVTSSTDLNPHMVFRPRDKEKRKLRKKRQNDIEAYNKMKMLKMDFERLDVLCDLIVRREGIHANMVDLTNEYYQERLYEWVDTTGLPRDKNQLLNRRAMENALVDIPRYFEDGPIVKMVKGGNKKRKRTSTATAVRGLFGGVGGQGSLHVGGANKTNTSSNVALHPRKNVVVAGHDDGFPAPNFLQPLATRESHHITSWDDAVPFIPSYENGKETPIHRFRHRPRLGRGGRIVIDRVPCPPPASEHDQPPPTVFTYGSEMKRSGYDVTVLGADGPKYNVNTSTTDNRFNAKGAPKATAASSLQELMPKSLGNQTLLSRRIEEICAMGLVEDYQSSTNADTSKGGNAAAGGSAILVGDGLDETLVPLEDWMEASEEIYGTEHFVIGPL